MLVPYNSLGDFAREAQKHNPNRVMEDACNGVTFPQAIEKAILGDDRLAAKANKLLDQLNVDMPATKVWRKKRSPFGGSVNFGDWLAGSPEPMRRRVKTDVDTAPLKIVVGVSCSSGITADQMERRGIVILALVLKLQEVRPLDLYLLTEDQARNDDFLYHLIKLETNPLALGTATFGLCSATIERHLSYTIISAQQGRGPAWPADYGTPGYDQRRRDRLGLTPEDLVIREAFLLDPLIHEPMEWLKDQLEKFTGAANQ